MSSKDFSLIGVFLSVVLLTSGCVSSRLTLQPQGKAVTRPADYTDFADYYFWGLSGHPSFDLQKICMDQKPWAAEQIRTGEDGIITAVTLGIYAPMTVRVWCGD